jgi:hypothetical protein
MGQQTEALLLQSQVPLIRPPSKQLEPQHIGGLFPVDRANAIQLLKALVTAGANSNTLMVKAWVQDIAVRDVSLRGKELSSALAYAEG